jgi:hypothetical protein
MTNRSRLNWPKSKSVRAIFLNVFLASLCLGAAEPDAIQRALARMYNVDYVSSARILEEHMAAQPADPLGPTFRAASDLFSELTRLQILEGEFFADDKRIAEKKRLKPDPALRANFDKYVARGRQLAEKRLAQKPDDPDALFALCITSGLVMDYGALIEKKQLTSLTYAKDAHRYAVRLLKVDPNYADAYMTTGFTEYLLGSLPFFLRWFVRFEDSTGDKNLGLQRLQKVVDKGKYLGPFARIMLSLAHLREKRYAECERLLAGLARDFPENPLFKKELVKVSELARGKRR